MRLAPNIRADLLPAAQAELMRQLLGKYLAQRELFYRARDANRLEQINASTTAPQNSLWSAVTGPAMAQPTLVAALFVSGMNDVLNPQGYTQAAWWDRVPAGARLLMGFMPLSATS